MKNVETRENALSIVNCFATSINIGLTATKEQWNEILDLMEKFNISLDEIKTK